MLSLLSLFRKPRGLDNDGWQQSWSSDLQTPYVEAINQFIKNKDLMVYSYTDEELFTLLTMKDLKDILKSKSLKVSGKKQELVDRLLEAGEIGSDYVDQSKFQHYVITDQAQNLVKQYLDKIEESKGIAENEVSKFIQSNEFSKAYEVVMKYKSQLPSSMRGEGLSVGNSYDSGSNQPNSPPEMSIWRMEQVEAIRKISQNFPQEMVQKAYEFVIWNRTIRGQPFTSDFIIQFMTSFNEINNKRELDRIRKNNWTKSISIASVHNSCTECKDLTARSPYKLDNVPKIPSPNCTNSSYGFCRCSYITS